MSLQRWAARKGQCTEGSQIEQTCTGPISAPCLD
jgi:hypothetical protein